MKLFLKTKNRSPLKISNFFFVYPKLLLLEINRAMWNNSGKKNKLKNKVISESFMRNSMVAFQSSDYCWTVWSDGKDTQTYKKTNTLSELGNDYFSWAGLKT